jgi:uncharacterized protein YbjT (DUF2867 family)
MNSDAPSQAADSSERSVLVTGATGYIGGRLVPRLLEAGFRVRCLVRDAARLQGRPWADRVEVVTGDVLQPETLRPAMRGVEVAYYLIHSMAQGPGFHGRDMKAAQQFAGAAAAESVGRIIYLGGLGDAEADLSPHLRSRQETGEALRSTRVPVTEFRAAVIVGSGSLSFEIIRYLTERLPAMICPRWVFSRVQPVAVRNVLDYLVAALDTPESVGRVIEIGGADVMSYRDMLTGYARVRGLKRWLISVPVLTPRLSSYWLYLITPVPVAVARPLIDGLRNDVVVRDDDARRLFPQIIPMGYEPAVRAALAKLQAGEVETAWSDALASTQGDVAPVALATQEGMIIEQRQLVVEAKPDAVYRAFSQLGGARGWPVNWAWQWRGGFDRLLGGVGMRRGRRHPTELRAGDALDFWRVESVEPGQLIRLRAEMKVPGKAWLQFKVTPQGANASVLTQTAFFAPKGLAGLLYWYALYPVHAWIFGRMIRQVGVAASDGA